jgi:hypothetical protein
MYIFRNVAYSGFCCLQDPVLTTPQHNSLYVGRRTGYAALDGPIVRFLFAAITPRLSKL